MPRSIDAQTQDFTAQPAFEEAAASAPADARSRLAQARADLAAMKEAKTEAAELRDDETLPGGVYIVGGELVDAWGNPVKDGE